MVFSIHPPDTSDSTFVLCYTYSSNTVIESLVIFLKFLLATLACPFALMKDELLVYSAGLVQNIDICHICFCLFLRRPAE